MAGPIRKVTRFQREINVTTTVPVQWSEKWSAPRTCPVFQVFLSDHSQYYMLHLCLRLTIRNEGFWRVILFALFLGGVFVYFPLYCFFNFCFCCLFEFLKGWMCRFVFFFFYHVRVILKVSAASTYNNIHWGKVFIFSIQNFLLHVTGKWMIYLRNKYLGYICHGDISYDMPGK